MRVLWVMTRDEISLRFQVELSVSVSPPPAKNFKNKTLTTCGFAEHWHWGQLNDQHQQGKEKVPTSCSIFLRTHFSVAALWYSVHSGTTERVRRLCFIFVFERISIDIYLIKGLEVALLSTGLRLLMLSA